MNEIILAGVIRNIKYSHTIKDIEYWQAEVVVTDTEGNNYSDIVPIKFKKLSLIYNEGDFVFLSGNIRSYSYIDADKKSHVQLYVFTYFDIPSVNEFNNEQINKFKLEGRICKIDSLHVNKQNKSSLHFILANNIFASKKTKKINNFCPIVAWGDVAINNEQLEVNTIVQCTGKFHSRMYKKVLQTGEIEFKIANELLANSIEKVN